MFSHLIKLTFSFFLFNFIFLSALSQSIFQNETIITITSNDTTDSDCFDLEDEFMVKLLFPMGALTGSIAEECFALAEKCPHDDDYTEFARSTGDAPFDANYCPMLDAYTTTDTFKTCFDILRQEDNKLELMNCTWNSINFNVLTENTPWTGPNDPRPEFKHTAEDYYLMIPSCQSILQDCTISMITDNCDTDNVLSALEKYQDEFQKGYCTGIEIYNSVEWNMFVFGELRKAKHTRVISDGVEKDID